MALNTNGLVYEAHVHDILYRNLKSPYKVSKPVTRTFSPHGYDLTIFKNDIEHHVEIKRNIKAQMGGTSLTYSDGAFKMVNNIHDSGIVDSLSHMKPYIEDYLDFMISKNPVMSSRKFPFMVPVDVWEDARDQGLLTNLNQNIPFDISFIKKHYSNKNCHYIQIGEKGLYHLGKNPMNLDIPELQGDVNIEVRLCRSGSKMKNGRKIAAANYRLQARLFNVEKSAVDLETDHHIF